MRACIQAWRLTALATALLATVFLLPHNALAQGTCACNDGCHQYPGQCVIGGRNGCSPGYAPFCDNRAGTCPHVGWVSCDGTCACIPIPGYDAGVPDASTLPDVPAVTDIAIGPGPDVPATLDAPVSTDVPYGTDVYTHPDVSYGTDVSSHPDVSYGTDVYTHTDVPPGVDGPSTWDAASASDVATARDALAAPTDGTVSLDGGPSYDAGVLLVQPNDGSTDGTSSTLGDAQTPCVCPGGVCLDGRCYTTPCTYQSELGFVCSNPGSTCRVIEGHAWCIPVCVDVTCAMGSFCDDTSGGTCTVDQCATIHCPAGLVCHHNQCETPGPDGGFDTADGSTVPGDGSMNAGATPPGCGCRAAGNAGSHTAWGILALAALPSLRRRRRNV